MDCVISAKVPLLWVATSGEALKIQNSLPNKIYSGLDYEYRPTALGGKAPYTFTLLEGPAAANVSTMGVLSWKTSQSDEGTTNIGIEVIDSNGDTATVYQSVEVLPLPINQSPVVISTPPVDATVGEIYTYQVEFEDVEGHAVTVLEPGEWNGGIGIDGNNLLSWLPTMDEYIFHQSRGGYKTLVVELMDSEGATTIHNFPVNMLLDGSSTIKPVVEEIGDQIAYIDQPFSVALAATNPLPFPLIFALAIAPQGMEISSDGIITWTPQAGQVGLTSILVEVSNTEGTSALAFDIDVRETQVNNTAPLITSIPATTVLNNEVYVYEVVATDPENDPLVYAIEVGPPESAVDSVGKLTWTPSTLGTEDFSITVTDGQYVVTQTFSVTVIDSSINNPPAITSTPELSALTNEEYTYQIVASDPEAQPLNYSLTAAPAGMTVSSTGQINWTPSDNGSYPVTVRVDDGVTFIEQSWSVVVTSDDGSNQPPQIVSTPTNTANVGSAYAYQLVANDPEGMALGYTLLSAPVGMSVTASGLISWTPTADVNTSVTVRVDDGASYVDQTWTITFTPDNPGNLPPTISSTPTVDAKVARIYQYPVVAADPEGATLNYTLLSAPVGMVVDAAGLISWTPTVSGSVSVTLGIDDGVNLIEQNWTITVALDIPLSANVTITPTPIVPGVQMTVTVIPVGAVGEVALEVTINGDLVVLDANDSVTVSVPATPGDYLIDIVIADELESTTVQESYSVVDTSDTQAPLVTLESPADLSTLTAEIDVLGSVSDDNIVEWRLTLSGERSGQLELGNGTTSVASAPLGVVDPSLLMNGIYNLTLEATDQGGNQSIDQIPLIIDGDLKVGNFSITFEDLSIPMVGIPIQVTRTYDSCQRQEALDFGYGWSIDYQNVAVQKSRPPGLGWEQNTYFSGPLGALATYCIEPQGAPLVTVTLPDGQVETFETAASPSCEPFIFLDTNLVFEPRAGTTSTLEAVGGTFGRLNQSTGIVGNITTGVPVNPDRYQLTTKAGYVYVLDQTFGIETVNV